MSIRPELRTLAPGERQELYESLIDESVDPEWERTWAEEIEQRMQEVRDDRVELIDADDVHRDLRADLRNASR